MRDRFWERYSLGELNSKEWEALCDGCGQCCLVREVKDNQMTVYSVACELLDIETARCKDYPNRQRKVPHCHKLTPKTVPLSLSTTGYPAPAPTAESTRASPCLSGIHCWSVIAAKCAKRALPSAITPYHKKK